MSTFSDYLSISTNLSRYQTMTASDPTVASATAYFQANIGNVTSAADLVKNTRLFNYVMTAYGLSDMTYAKSLIQQALEQGTSSSSALANKLNNPQITALVNAFDFSANGPSTTQQSGLAQTVTNNYVMQTLETNENNTSPGVALALFLPMHFLVLGLAIDGEARLGGFLSWTQQPLVKLAEAGLIFCLAVHLIGGLRVLMLETRGWRPGQRNLAILGVASAAIVAVAFLIGA